jgi:hypothetical protein
MQACTRVLLRGSTNPGENLFLNRILGPEPTVGPIHDPHASSIGATSDTGLLGDKIVPLPFIDVELHRLQESSRSVH